MNRRIAVRALALAGALALYAALAVRGDDWEARAIVNPDTLIRGVTIPQAFRGLDGKSHPGGLYDLKIHQGTQGILIGLLQGGTTIGQFPGKFVPGAFDPPAPIRKAGADPPGGTQGHDISIRKAGGQQDIHFDVSSKVSFGGGGGAGKISPSANLHPGGANFGFISFELAGGQASGK
jgi:hypothetical protein